jgi:hypothetical protein
MARWIVTNTTTLARRSGPTTYYAGTVVEDGEDPVSSLDAQGAFLVEEGTSSIVDEVAEIARQRKLKGVVAVSLNELMISARLAELFLRKTIWFPADPNFNNGSYRVRDVPTNSSHRFNLSVPVDFRSIVSLDLVFIPSAAATGAGKNIDLISEYAAVGEPSNQHSESDTTSLYDIGPAGAHGAIDLRGVFTHLSPGDIGGVVVGHNLIGGAIDYLGIRMVYNRLG